MNEGMSTPMSDRDYTRLMTTNIKGQFIPAAVALFAKHFPHLMGIVEDMMARQRSA